MGWYRRLIYDAFRGCCRKISPVESFCSRSNPTRSKISHPIFRNSVLQNVVKNNQSKSPYSFATRFYSKSNHLNAKEFGRWSENRRNLIRLGLLGCGASCVYYWNLETVPFTKRRHSVLVSTSLEKKMSEWLFQLHKSENKGKILPSHHPQSIRVEKIGHDIIRALLKGLRKTNQHKYTTCAHLEEFNWEFIVVDEPARVSSFCCTGGKIVVSTGIFNYLKTDDEIAHLIGHEVAHAIARHHMSELWRVLIQAFLSDYFKRQFDLFIRLPLCRRDEMEADYIGLLVGAYAGYDPRIAPQVWLKLGCNLPSRMDDCWSMHPNAKKRAQLLSQPKVMEEALSIYRETSKGKDKYKEEALDFLNRSIGISLIVLLFIL